MKALHRIFGVLTCFPVVLSLLLLPLLPERIPAHYNLYGEVDHWGSRLEVLLLPLCCLVGGLIWKRLIQKMSLTQPQNQKPMLVAGCSLLAALDALSCVILFFSFSAADVPQTGLLLPQLLNILLGLSLLPLGTAMPKVKRNGVLGLRTKWSMANDRCWELCQRAGGKSLLLTGVLLIAGSLLIGNRLWLNLLPIALLILDGIFCILYSYRVWKKYSS